MNAHEYRSRARLQIMQAADELGAFCRFIEAHQLKRYLEIGLATGGTWRFLTAFCGFEHSCGITLDGSILGRRIGPVFVGDSTSREAVGWAAAQGPFDLVFIDGSHHEQDVLADWRNYRGLARYVAFHDGLRCSGVTKALARIRLEAECLEEISSMTESPLGISIFQP